MTKYSLGSEEARFFGDDLPGTELNIASRGQVIEQTSLDLRLLTLLVLYDNCNNVNLMSRTAF
jgi:hypothetical protein